MTKLPLILEMETSDPDDFLTLCWLADHPDVDLRAVVVTPGTVAQCRLVRWGLDKCGKTDVPIGAFDIGRDKECVSAWHYKTFGDHIKEHDPGEIKYGPDLVGGLLGGSWPSDEKLTYLVGSAPKNLGQAHRHFGELRLDRWVQQGFFAGDNVVPPEFRLDKFKGKHTCPSFNPNGDPRSALELLASDHIRRKVAVSKNVCHGARWTPAFRNKFIPKAAAHHQVENLKLLEKHRWLRAENLPMVRTGLRMMVLGFETYLQRGAEPDPNIPWEMDSEKQGQGKAMHDLVAAAVCLDESVVYTKEVDIYRERGEWGSRLRDGTRTWISIGLREDRFIDVLCR